MNELTGTANIPLAVDLRGLNVEQFRGVSREETAILRRNTIWPKQDFLIIPLNSSTGQSILRRMGGGVPQRIMHMQIEKRWNSLHIKNVY
jgi:hypothetical protein